MSDGHRSPWLLIDRNMGFDTQLIIQRLLVSMFEEQGAALQQRGFLAVEH